MRAVILAAGRGTRLGGASDGLPKCLLQIGGRPLILSQLESLSEAGVSPVLMVVGHGADLVREAVGARVEYAVNPRYESTNSLASFLQARAWAKGPILVINCDVLFDVEVLERVLKAGPDCLAYDSASGYGAEHMKLRLESGRVTAMSKELPKEDASGENVGMLCLSDRATHIIFTKGQEIFDAGRPNAFMAEAVRASLGEIEMRGVDVAGLPWVEIDSPFDLERARKEVWPALRVREGTRVVGYRKRRRRRAISKLALAAAAAALIFGGGWFLSTLSEQSWGVVPPNGAAVATSLEVKGTPQEWWKTLGTAAAKAEIKGPQDIRIDIRGILPAGEKTERPYVVEIRIDGAVPDWHKLTASPDETASLADHAVCDRDKFDVSVPAGAHRVFVRLVAGDLDGLLLRFRVPE